MKKIIIFVCLCLGLDLFALNVPNNMIFRAMQDEMKRTYKNLKLKNSPKPFFISYSLVSDYSDSIEANLGELFPDEEKTPLVRINGYMNVGTPKIDSWGIYVDEKRPISIKNANNYIGVRQAFWELSDDIYKKEITDYNNKVSYRQQKNIVNKFPDFLPAKPGYFVEPILEFKKLDREALQEKIKEISAMGKKNRHIYHSYVSLDKRKKDYYLLTSEEGIAQYSTNKLSANITVLFQSEDGEKIQLGISIDLKNTSNEEIAKIESEMLELLSFIEQTHQAKEVEPYIGPVLVNASHASSFFDNEVGHAMSDITPVLGHEQEVGNFSGKKGLKVMPKNVNIYSKPQQRYFNGYERGSFSPVDMEGVLSEDITLIENGRVKEYPRTRRGNKEKEPSNGHSINKREIANAIIVEPTEKLTKDELEKKFLEICQQEEQEYCYIEPKYARRSKSFLWKVFVKDGHRELVRNADISELSLQNMVAFGDDYNPATGLLTPSIIFKNVEVMPNKKPADRKPLIEKP